MALGERGRARDDGVREGRDVAQRGRVERGPEALERVQQRHQARAEERRRRRAQVRAHARLQPRQLRAARAGAVVQHLVHLAQLRPQRLPVQHRERTAAAAAAGGRQWGQLHRGLCGRWRWRGDRGTQVRPVEDAVAVHRAVRRARLRRREALQHVGLRRRALLCQAGRWWARVSRMHPVPLPLSLSRSAVRCEARQSGKARKKKRRRKKKKWKRRFSRFFPDR